MIMSRYKKACLPSTQQDGTTEGDLRHGEGGKASSGGCHNIELFLRSLLTELCKGGSRGNGLESIGARETSSVAVGSNQSWGLRHRYHKCEKYTILTIIVIHLRAKM